MGITVILGIHRKIDDLSSDSPLAIKADGRGMTIPLQLVDVSSGPTVQLEDNTWHLTRLTNFSGYSCHIAIKHPMDTLTSGLELHEVDLFDDKMAKAQITLL